MNTRKHPRTMREAFGPYVDNRLEPMRDKSLEPLERRYQDLAIFLIGIASIALMLSLWAFGH